MAPIHENVCDRAVPAACCRWSQSIDQEARELIFIHLAHAHREVAVADAPGATDVAVDRNIVWWIGTDQIDGFSAEKRRIGGSFARISAEEFVTSEYPKVTRLRNGRSIVPIFVALPSRSLFGDNPCGQFTACSACRGMAGRSMG